MTTTAQFIVNGLKLKLPEKLAGYVESGLDTTCGITGAHITEGIPWKRVVPSSTAEYLDLMHGMAFEYLSVSAAIAFKGSWNMGSRLIFEDGTMYHPYFGAKSAAKSERTYWSALVRSIWPEREGQNCLCIMAGDFKKKIWPRATVGPMGANTPVLVFDPDRFVLQNAMMDWAGLIDVLDLVEEVYGKGFNKRAIANSLFSDHTAVIENIDTVVEYEQRLQGLRKRPEFAAAILIAQKKKGE